MAPIADARAPLTDVRVGILGGGQLGRMLAQAASPLGLYTAVLDPAGDKASAADAAAAAVAGDFKKAEDIIRFVDAVRPHVLTVEIEHVNVDALEAVQRERGRGSEPAGLAAARRAKRATSRALARNAAAGIPVYPTPGTIALIQDKYRQKEHFQYAALETQ